TSCRRRTRPRRARGRRCRGRTHGESTALVRALSAAVHEHRRDRDPKPRDRWLCSLRVLHRDRNGGGSEYRYGPAEWAEAVTAFAPLGIALPPFDKAGAVFTIGRSGAVLASEPLHLMNASRLRQVFDSELWAKASWS